MHISIINLHLAWCPVTFFNVNVLVYISVLCLFPHRRCDLIYYLCNHLFNCLMPWEEEAQFQIVFSATQHQHVIQKGCNFFFWSTQYLCAPCWDAQAQWTLIPAFSSISSTFQSLPVNDKTISSRISNHFCLDSSVPSEITSKLIGFSWCFLCSNC